MKVAAVKRGLQKPRDVYAAGSRALAGPRAARDLGRAANPHLPEEGRFPEGGHSEAEGRGDLGGSLPLRAPSRGSGGSHSPATGSELTRAGGAPGRAPPTPDAGGGARGGAALLLGGERSGPLEKVPCAPAPNARRGGEGARRVSALLLAEGGGPQPGSAAVPAAGSRGPAPRRWGLGGGTDSTPLPLRPLAVQGTPRPRECGGWGRQPGGPEPCRGAGRGGARMGARPPPPRGTARQRGPPRSRARGGPQGGGRGWQGREQTPGLCPPLLRRSPPPPTSPTRSGPQTPH